MRPIVRLSPLLALALCGVGCDSLSEVVARERLGSSGGQGGESPVETGGSASLGGSPDPGSGGASPGLQSPRFEAPIPVDALNDPVAKDQDPTITGDQLEIFFFSDRGANADIWSATRADIDAEWETPAPVAELNSVDVEQNPAVSRDGLRIWFYSSRDPLGIYFAERTTREDAFSAPEPVVIIGGDGDPDGFPIAPSVDENELRMVVSIGAGLTRDLYELVRPSTAGKWGEAVLLEGVNSDHVDSTPFLIGDGREMLFHSGRVGGGDLYWAYREAPGLPFTEVVNLEDVNDPVGFESHPDLTEDGRWMYFGSNRTGNTDIYVAERIQD